MGLDIVAIFIDIEDTFGLRISDREAQQCATVQDLHDAILRHLGQDGVDPEHVRCLGCRYNLQGLARKTCPECSKPFVQPEALSPGQVFAELQKLLAHQMGVDPDKIRPEHHLVKDLGFG